MRNYTRFIPGEEIGAVEQWDFGAVDSRALLLAAQVRVQQQAAEREQQPHEGAIARRTDAAGQEPVKTPRLPQLAAQAVDEG
jgi:hypothetical protein